MGTELKDGRLVFYVFSDNDFFPNLPTRIYAFAIDTAAAGISYRPQPGCSFPSSGPGNSPRP